MCLLQRSKTTQHPIRSPPLRPPAATLAHALEATHMAITSNIRSIVPHSSVASGAVLCQWAVHRELRSIQGSACVTILGRFRVVKRLEALKNKRRMPALPNWPFLFPNNLQSVQNSFIWFSLFIPFKVSSPPFANSQKPITHWLWLPTNQSIHSVNFHIHNH